MTSKPIAVVTGAASGIGRALALELNARGYRLAICDLDDAGVNATGEQLDDAFGCAVDVRSKDAVDAFAKEVETTLGTPALVVHNAGVSLAARVERMAMEDFEWVMQVNFWGMVYGCKAFLPSMLEHGGTQVFISSVFGIVGVPTQSAYNASKFAIRGFAESLRQETEGRMDVLVVCPGGVRTNIVRNGRIQDWPTGSPQDDPSVTFERAARLTPEEAAKAIVDAVRARKQRLVLGTDAKVLDTLQRLMPESYPKATRRLINLLSPSKGSN